MIEAVEYLAQLIREQYPDAILERIRSQELDARRGVKIIYYHQSGPASGAAAPRTPGTGQYTAVVPCTLIGVAADDMGVEDADLDLALYMQSLTDWLLQLRPVYPTNPPTRKTHSGSLDIPRPQIETLVPEKANPSVGPLVYEGGGGVKSKIMYEVSFLIYSQTGTSVYEDPGRPEYYVGREPDPEVTAVPTPVTVSPDVQVG